MNPKRRPRIKELRTKGIYILPNLFTSGNLFCGFFSAISSLGGRFEVAAMAILFATVFDCLDGKLARLTKTTSRFGVEYDSLSDVVSFGMAPGLLIYAWALNAYGRLGWVAAFLFMVCGALRLARFNVQVSGVESKDFVGLPIPAAAGFLATWVLLDGYIFNFGKDVRPGVILAVTYVLAFLMVSSLRYRSFKEFNLKNRKPFSVLVSLVLVLLVLVNAPQIMLFSLFALYCSSGILEKPIQWLYQFIRKSKDHLPRELDRGDIEDKKNFLKHD